MTENEIIETAKRLKRVGGYVMDGKLAKFQMTPVEARNGIAVYLLVWRKRDDELLFLVIPKETGLTSTGLSQLCLLQKPGN